MGWSKAEFSQPGARAHSVGARRCFSGRQGITRDPGKRHLWLRILGDPSSSGPALASTSVARWAGVEKPRALAAGGEGAACAQVRSPPAEARLLGPSPCPRPLLPSPLQTGQHPGQRMNNTSSCPNSCPVGLLVPASGASACVDPVSFLSGTLLLSALLNLTEVWLFKNKVNICFVILLKPIHSVSLCSWLPFVPW